MRSFARTLAVLAPALALALTLAIPVETTTIGTYPLRTFEPATAPSRIAAKGAVALACTPEKKPLKGRTDPKQPSTQIIPPPKKPSPKKPSTQSIPLPKAPRPKKPNTHGMPRPKTNDGARNMPDLVSRPLAVVFLTPLLLSRLASVAVLGLAFFGLLYFPLAAFLSVFLQIYAVF
ncbi:hypothetical protein RB594_007805 [Gaeumannomyces avenae]